LAIRSNYARTARLALPASAILMVGISPIIKANAQDDPPPQVKARAIIRTSDGTTTSEQVIDLDPNEIGKFGDGNVMMFKAGPDGQIMTFGGPSMSMNGPGGLATALPDQAPQNYGLYVIDPGVSYLYALLKRIDVGSEIRLNARQREALEAAETNAQQTRQEQLKASVQKLAASLQGQSPEELKAGLADRAAKIQDIVKGFTDTRLKTLTSILRPEQLARLKELDYQFRGPLAMGVRDVAAQTTLDADMTTKVSALLREYRATVNKNLPANPMLAMLKTRGGAPAAPPAPEPNSEEMRGRLVKADRAIRKARFELGAKALAGLPDAQRAAWAKLTGKPFEFHPAL